ncbi:MAG: DUF4163 domain-containing protein [Anaerolineaceae bacterium]|nr:MAG: DUF4163 domain-containing protein [Anaerolineaceae bacterium]
MFCTNCGNKLDGSDKFCTNCGTPASNQLPDNTNSTGDWGNVIEKKDNATLPPKRNNKIIPIMVGLVALIILAGGVTGFFFYRKHIDKQADNVMAYIYDRKYDQALTLYNKYTGKKESFDNMVFTELRKTTEQIKEDYMSEKIDYNNAQGQLQNLDRFKIATFDMIIYDVAQWIDKINTSRANYHDGKALYEQGDYESALASYGLVVREDTKYYGLALEDISISLEKLAKRQNELEIKEEEERQLEARRQEEEKINEIREQTLAGAEEYALYSFYEAAIQVIEDGLKLIPNDPVLTERLILYNSLTSLYTSVPAFDTIKYEYTYMEEDKEIMIVSLELPILLGDIPTYESINQVFEQAKESHMIVIDRMVEDARSLAKDEYFITSGYGLSYSVQYNMNGILCIVLDGYIYAGGAHGFPIKETFTFDLTTGDMMNLSDLISVDGETFAMMVIDGFQNMYNEAPEEYWDDAPSIVANDALNMENLNYYLTDDSICIFYFPYDLGSYARGFVDIVIPYAGNEWMFNFNYIQ